MKLEDHALGRQRVSGLGFRREEAEHLLIRADLMIEVQRLIASHRLQQKAAAEIVRVTQPRMSALLRGRIDLFTTDALIDMLARVRVRVTASRRSLKVASRPHQARGGHQHRQT